MEDFNAVIDCLEYEHKKIIKVFTVSKIAEVAEVEVSLPIRIQK